MDKITGNKS